MGHVYRIEQFDDQFGNGTLSHTSNFGRDFFADPVVAMLELQRLPFAGQVQRYNLSPNGTTISAGVPYRKFSGETPGILTHYWHARCAAYGLLQDADYLYAEEGGLMARDRSDGEAYLIRWSDIQQAEDRFHEAWYGRYERRRTADNPDGIGDHSRPQHILYMRRANFDTKGNRVMALAPSSIPSLYGAALYAAEHYAFSGSDSIWDRLGVLWYLQTLHARGLKTIRPDFILNGWGEVVKHLRAVRIPIDSPQMACVRAELADMIYYGTGDELPYKAGRFMVAVRQMTTHREHVAGNCTPLMDRVYMTALKLRDEQDSAKNRKALISYARALSALL